MAALQLMRQSQSNADAQSAISAWHRYVHLYAPMIGSIFNRHEHATTLGLFCDTHLSRDIIVLPHNRTDPMPEQAIRFTRKNDFYRAGVIATYGWLFDAPYRVTRYIMDALLSLGADLFIDEHAVGTKQRWSNFMVALLWIVGSKVVQFCLAFDTFVLQ